MGWDGDGLLDRRMGTMGYLWEKGRHAPWGPFYTIRRESTAAFWREEIVNRNRTPLWREEIVNRNRTPRFNTIQ